MSGHVLSGTGVHNPSEHVGLLPSSMCGKGELIFLLLLGSLVCTLLVFGLAAPTMLGNVTLFATLEARPCLLECLGGASFAMS